MRAIGEGVSIKEDPSIKEEKEVKSVITYSSSTKPENGKPPEEGRFWSETVVKTEETIDDDNNAGIYDHQYTAVVPKTERPEEGSPSQGDVKPNKLPNFQASYGVRVDDMGRRIETRSILEQAIQETDKKVERDRNFNSRSSLDQNKGTVHHYPNDNTMYLSKAEEALKMHEQLRYPSPGKLYLRIVIICFRGVVA